MTDEIHRLENMKAVVRSILSKDMIADLEIHEGEPSALLDHYVMKVRFHLFGLLDSVEEIPANWWQAVRRRWCPGWWLRQFPLRTRRLKLYQAVYFKPSDDPLWGTRSLPVEALEDATR